MLELTAQAPKDLLSTSLCRGHINVLFAENDALCPQPYNLTYVVNSDGTPYVSFDNLCSMTFHEFTQLEHAKPLLAYRALFSYKAQYCGDFLFIPISELKQCAVSFVELLEHLVNSNDRLESAALFLASERFKALSADSDKLYKLVDTIEQLREYVDDYLDWLYDARRKAETALQSEEREIWHKHGGYVSDENGNNPADCFDGYLRDIETATEQIELIESTLFGPEPVDLGADTDGAVL